MQIIEIKKPRHRLSNTEMDRIVTYYDNMKAFLEDPGHDEFRKLFGMTSISPSSATASG